MSETRQQSNPRSFASRKVVETQHSEVTPTMKREEIWRLTRSW